MSSTPIASRGAVRLLARTYGLTADEARRLAEHPRHRAIISAVDQWRAQHGYPAPSSPLVRGYLKQQLELPSDDGVLAQQLPLERVARLYQRGAVRLRGGAREAAGVDKDNKED